MNSEAPATDLRQLLTERSAQQAQLGESTDWLSPRRDMAADEMLQMPMPNRKHEAWRYTSTAFLEQEAFQLASGEGFDALELSDIEHLLISDDTHRLVFVNGRLMSGLTSLTGSEEGLAIGNLASGAGDVAESVRDQLGHIGSHRHVFEALNTALMADGSVVHVARDAHLSKPIELLHISIDLETPAIIHPRHLLVLEEGSRAEVIERYCSIGESRYFNNALIEVSLEKDSELRHQRVQEESRSAQHISDLHVQQKEGSRYFLAQASLGAAWSRSDIRLEFAGEHAHAEVDGLLLANDRQLTDLHLEVRHDVANCTSREVVKGILDGKGRVVFDGHIHVARDAQKTDAMLSNDNLLLSRAAEVDTKPQLEIYADDVKCSHGTTVGELDQDMLFYLRSRGIGEAQAQQMLCQGFAQQALDAIGNEPLRQRVAWLLASRLGGGE